MPVNVFDASGQQYLIGESFRPSVIDLPLVTENRTRHSFPFGDAELVQIAFSGIYIVYGDMMMREAQTLLFDMSGESDLVELHFTLAGNGAVYNEHSGARYIFRENECNMHYIPHFTGRGEYRKNEPYRFFEVHFTSKFFGELAEDSAPVLMDFAQQVAGNNGSELVSDNLQMTFAMHQCIQEIMHCNLKGGLKLMFLQSKCIELLALQAQAYEELRENSPHHTIKTSYDIERIQFAREYLVRHALQPPSLVELAHIAGINEFKLKKGFRELFDNSVFGYLNDYRLHEARNLLVSGEGVIKDVADRFGFSSVQHFSKAFKQKFGVPPGQCLPSKK